MKKHHRNNNNLQDYAARPRDYTALCWAAALRVLNAEMRSILRQVGLWDDIRQEILLVAFECARERLTVKETLRAADRAIYHALVAMGFRKPRGGRWGRKDWDFTEIKPDIHAATLHDSPHLLLIVGSSDEREEES